MEWFNDPLYCDCHMIPTGHYKSTCNGCQGYLDVCRECHKCWYCRNLDIKENKCKYPLTYGRTYFDKGNE